MSDLSEPQYCFKCQTIVTFCECDHSILSEGDWQRWAEDRISVLEAENERLVEIACEAFESDDPGSFKEWCDMNGYKLEQAND